MQVSVNLCLYMQYIFYGDSNDTVLYCMLLYCGAVQIW